MSLIALVACNCGASKVLNESLARSLIQEALRTETYQVSLAPIADQVQRYGFPYAMLDKFVENKILALKIDTVTYPDVSGTWVNQLGGKTYTLTLRMVVQSNKFIGRCDGTGGFGGAASNDDLGGSVESDGTVNFSENTGYCFEAGQMQAVYDATGALNVPAAAGNAARVFKGPAGKPKVEVKWHDYSFSSDPHLSWKSEDNSIGGIISTGQLSKKVPYVGVGKFEVGAVSDLQLLTETRAVAKFTWQLTLDTLARSVLGDKGRSGDGQAAFVKKPDGTWVHAEHVIDNSRDR